MAYGWVIAILEILIFFIITYVCKKRVAVLSNINPICYYWLCMTILTGIWEASYISNYHEIEGIAKDLITNKEHAWTNQYSLSYVWPWKLAKIFYAEYGAWADREYMSLTDVWSHTIEGTHALFCASFALGGMITRLDKKTVKSLIMVGMAMAFQLMNSILYMVEYSIQCNDKDSVNFNTPSFPTGIAMVKRFFMWVNIFWILMPSYIIWYELRNVKIISVPKNNDNANANANAYADSNSNKSKDIEYTLETPPAYGVNDKLIDEQHIN